MYTLPATLASAKDADSIFLVECYVFHLKTGDLYITSADQDITIDGQLYMSVPIQRNKYTANSDSKVDDCTLKVENCDDRFTAALYSGTDFRGCMCFVFQALYPNVLTDATLIKPILYGYLDCPILNQKEATFEVTVKSQVPNLTNYRTFQLSCNAEFADGDSCMASKNTTTGTCQSGTTNSTIVLESSYADNYWYNGVITCGYESRMIQSSSGNTVTVHYSFTDVPTSYTIELGCDKSFACCKLRGQQTNFSGFVSVPWETVIRAD